MKQVVSILTAHMHNPTVARKCLITLKELASVEENVTVESGALEGAMSAIRFHKQTAEVVASACAVIAAIMEDCWTIGLLDKAGSATDIFDAIRLHIGDAGVVKNGFTVLHYISNIDIEWTNGCTVDVYETIMDSIRVHRNDEDIIYSCAYLLGLIIVLMEVEIDHLAMWDKFASV